MGSRPRLSVSVSVSVSALSVSSVSSVSSRVSGPILIPSARTARRLVPLPPHLSLLDRLISNPASTSTERRAIPSAVAAPARPLQGHRTTRTTGTKRSKGRLAEWPRRPDPLVACPSHHAGTGSRTHHRQHRYSCRKHRARTSTRPNKADISSSARRETPKTSPSDRSHMLPKRIPSQSPSPPAASVLTFSRRKHTSDTPCRLYSPPQNRGSTTPIPEGGEGHDGAPVVILCSRRIPAPELRHLAPPARLSASSGLPDRRLKAARALGNERNKTRDASL